MKKMYFNIAGAFAAVVFLVMIIAKPFTKNNVEYAPSPFNQALATSIENTPLTTKTNQAPTTTLLTPMATEQPLDVAISPHTVNGYTATIETSYVDVSHIIFGVRITGGTITFGNEHFYDRVDTPFSGDRQTREKMILDAKPETLGGRR